MFYEAFFNRGRFTAKELCLHRGNSNVYHRLFFIMFYFYGGAGATD